MRERQVWRQVHTGKDVAVVGQGAQTVTPGVGSDEAVVSVCRKLNRVVDAAIDRIAAITHFILAFQPAHMGVTDFAYDSHPTRAEHLIEEVREGRLDLRDFLAVVTAIVGTGRGLHR